MSNSPLIYITTSQLFIPPEGNHPLATSTPVSEESSGESLDEIMEAYSEYTQSMSRSNPSLSPSSITHISETELHDNDTSTFCDSNTQGKWQNVTVRKKKQNAANISNNSGNITHISESSGGETFPEDLSPLSSSSSDDISSFPKVQYYPVTTYSSTDSSDFTMEGITRYRPNFSLTKISFEQLAYFLKRYLRSVELHPDKPEWPVHGMDKNQKRHFRRKVEDYKLQNGVLYHLHTYTEIVQGETIRRCMYFYSV